MKTKPTRRPSEAQPGSVGEAVRPTISELLPQAIHESLDKGVNYEELICDFSSMVRQETQPLCDLLPEAIRESLGNGVPGKELTHRFASMVLQIVQERLRVQRQERLKADVADEVWTPQRLRAEQDRLVDGTEKDPEDDSGG